jgi:hypothetical protein
LQRWLGKPGPGAPTAPRRTPGSDCATSCSAAGPRKTARHGHGEGRWRASDARGLPDPGLGLTHASGSLRGSGCVDRYNPGAAAETREGAERGAVSTATPEHAGAAQPAL